jgi:hypothetical protein
MSDERVVPQVVIGPDNGDHLTIQILGRLHPGASDFWDGNWLATPVRVVAGGFRAEVGAALRCEELGQFREALEKLYASLQRPSDFRVA